ncbi:hypothetical protein Tco_0625959 [Tanacetum coccineum]|uniref:Uncharacterized protein n=1 Tax=Tanacetum coccineum TaxID=301880 RepID=A0ABQ4WIF3_9ASTR
MVEMMAIRSGGGDDVRRGGVVVWMTLAAGGWPEISSEKGEELGLTIPFEYTTYYTGVGQLSFSQHITCLRVSSYPAPTYQSYQQLCLLVTIDAYPSLLLLRSVKVLSPKGSMGIKSILNRGFRKLSIQSQMIVPTSRFFPSANSTEYLMSTVDVTMPLKELNSAEVRLL